jgi:hypothetical protein
MTPEQLQQISNSAMAGWISAVPWWIKLLALIQIGAQLACLICLPLITWKLWRNNGRAKASVKSAPLPPAILDRQARRDAIRKMAETPPSAPGTRVCGPDDSKYLPPE